MPESVTPEPATHQPSADQQAWLGSWLQTIDGTLRSIRTALWLLFWLFVAGMLFAACNVLLSI